MEIKGLDYNTQRSKLILSEYGREIQKMVDLAITLPTKEERNACAKTIIRQMENKNTQLRTTPDYEQTLWDHLYLMSHKQLDIDWPYDVNESEKILSKPQPLQHPAQDEQAHMRHYGRLLSKVFEKLKTMPEGDERDELARFTDGKIQIDLQRFRFNAVDISGDGIGNGSKRKRKK